MFEKQKIRIIAISTDNVEDAANTQKKFPHLMIVSDESQNLTKAVEVMGTHKSPDGKELVEPTSIFIDRNGKVRHIFRGETFLTRLNGEEVLKLATRYFSR